jgi:asparagine synthase (glutamine-hydrolysing)
MCGIWSKLSKISSNDSNLSKFLSKRGPDMTKEFIDENIHMVFHRLSINDFSQEACQPMICKQTSDLVLICNGEIYNHKELHKQYNMDTNTNCDCEVILNLYNTLQNISTIIDTSIIVNKMCLELDGEYAFILYDKKRMKCIIVRDNFGVRPLFYDVSQNDVSQNDFTFSSELKGINTQSTVQFLAGHFMIIDMNTMKIENVHNYNKSLLNSYLYKRYQNIVPSDIYKNINRLLTNAVKKRITNSDVKVCGLLSGGVDSSLICALAAKENPNFETFSIGMKGSTDLHYAKIVAEHIKSKHTTIELDKTTFLDAIEETIKVIESYDITSVRASIGNYLVSKYIRENTDNKVVLNGDYSDEIFGSYIYLKTFESPEAFNNECHRLVKDIQYFDSLRSDRTVSANGLEARTPFSDKELVNYVLTIPPKYRMSNPKYNIMEKYILRKSFDNNLLPNEVLYRHKEAFSDGVSHKEESLYQLIQQHVEQFITDDELKNNEYTYNKPQTKEALYYINMFHKYYKNEKTIPYFWMPRNEMGEQTAKDPSARTLTEIYK